MSHVSFTETKPVIQDEDIVRAERILGCTLPEEYRRFLLKENGGRPSLEAFNIQWNDNPVGDGWGASLIHFFLSIHDGDYSNLIEYNNVDFKGRIPKDTVAIAYDQGGNLLLMGVGESNRGKIFFWVKDHEVEEGETPDYSNIGNVAETFSDFLSSLYGYGS